MLVIINLESKRPIPESVMNTVISAAHSEFTKTSTRYDVDDERIRGCLIEAEDKLAYPTENMVLVATPTDNFMYRGKLIATLVHTMAIRRTNVDVLIVPGNYPKRAAAFCSSGVFVIDVDDVKGFEHAMGAMRTFSSVYRDAARFNALCDTGTMRLLGSAGFTESKHTREEYKHFGCEMWTVGMEGTYEQDETRDHFERYTDTLVSNSHNGIVGRGPKENNDE